MQPKKSIPLVDLQRQKSEIGDEIMSAIAEVVESQYFINGPRVRALECEFAGAHGDAYGVGCANGTSAISLVLDTLGIGTGDEVITVSHTFFATAGSISNAGADITLVDVEPGALTMDVDALEAAITPRTRAIMPVHIYGTPANMSAITKIAKKHDLFVIEDAAQAHLAKWCDQPVGTLGHAATFSFYPAKNLGAYGDAGFVLSTNKLLADRVRQLANHGRTKKYEHELMGYNARMDEIQAAVLKVKLAHLENWNVRRRTMAARYDAALKSAGFKTLQPPEQAEPVYHLYVVEVSNREEVQKYLLGKGIETGVHYPVPIHLQPVYADKGWRRGQFPVTERAVDRILSLPMCGSIGADAVDATIESFLEVAQP